MPVQTFWDDETKATVRLEYVGKWTWEEVAAALAEEFRLMNSVPHKVSVIHDLGSSTGLPGGALTNARRFFTAGLPPNGDMGVIVGTTALIEVLLNVFKKVYPEQGARFRSAPTLDKARVLIAQQCK